MCRLIGYLGPEIALEDVIVRPRHSLLAQSQHATEAKLAVNGDGFGVAWYDDRAASPGLYRDVLPAWADDNLINLCRMVHAPLFLAHVRASTMGETSRVNCHPFVYGNWTFCHNGQVPHFPAIRRQLEAALPDHLYDARRGTTDSEMLFLTLLANGLDRDPPAALAATLNAVTGPDVRRPVKLTCVLSDGKRLYGFRYGSDGIAPTLYCCRSHAGGVFASEPLNGVAKGWELVPANTLWCLDAKGCQSEPLTDHLPPVRAVVA